MEYCCDRPDHVVLWKIGKVHGTLRWKAIEYSQCNGLVYGSLYNKSVERNADNEAWFVKFQREAETLSETFICYI